MIKNNNIVVGLKSPKLKLFNEKTSTNEHINFSKQELRTLNKEKVRFLRLLGDINRSFKQFSKGKYIEDIQFSDNSENITQYSGIDNTLGKEFTRKKDRVRPYHDLESRQKFEEELVIQYTLNQNAIILKKKESEEKKTAQKQRELLELFKKSRLGFIKNHSFWIFLFCFN